MKALRVAGLIFALAGMSAPLQAQLITNGGFETGDLTGWSQSGSCGFSGLAGSGVEHSGSFGYFSGAIGSTCTLSQNIATTIGQQYTFSFWVTNAGGGTNSFQALFGGQSLYSQNNASAFPYTQQRFNATATTGSTTVSFVIRNDPSFYYLDDVSVVSANTTVPEPSTYALMAAGLAGLGVFARRRRAK